MKHVALVGEPLTGVLPGSATGWVVADLALEQPRPHGKPGETYKASYRVLFVTRMLRRSSS